MTVVSLGTMVRLVAKFYDDERRLADPSWVTVRIKNSSGAVSSYSYGVDPAAARDGVGVYHYDLTLSASGTWHYRFEGTGAVVAAVDGSITVPPSEFE